MEHKNIPTKRFADLVPSTQSEAVPVMGQEQPNDTGPWNWTPPCQILIPQPREKTIRLGWQPVA